MIERVRSSRRDDQIAIDAALSNPDLLGAALGNASSWSTWLTVLRAAYGLPLSEPQRATFSAISGNRTPPSHQVKELWCVVGRRSGKSRMAAALAVHVALLQGHKLAAGEVGFVLVLSPTTLQSRIIFGYVRGFIEQSPVLRQEIIGATASEIRLRNNIVISTHPNSFRSVRGRTLVACIFDESSFWRDEASALPDIEAYRAVLPALATSRGPLIAISTPYRRMGLIFQKYKDFFGVDDPNVLVVSGYSTTFNPTLDSAAIAKATADDPQAAIAEWGGQFRSDISAFLSDADIDAVVDFNRPLELPPQSGQRYVGFVDPSGGRHDDMALGIAHKNADTVFIDVVRGRHPPFDPKSVIEEFAGLLKEYRINEVIGDNYSGEWVVTAFKDAGIGYRKSELPKSKLYLEGLPSFTRRLLSLPDHPRLLRELRLLERRPHVGGRDTVDHGRNGSDDYANAVFGALYFARQPKQRIRMYAGGVVAGVPMVEVDIKTGRPIRPERTGVRFVRLSEKEAPAVQGLVHSKLGS